MPDTLELRRNVVLVVLDDVGVERIGAYGEGPVGVLPPCTPNLDALAAQGVRYTRVFSTNPACAPSRSAFFTGMYQTTTGTHPMRSHRNDNFRLPPGVRPITHWLRDAGYFTANIKTAAGARVGDLLLQHRGHLLMGAGHSIAQQNFNENISILLLTGAYALMVRADWHIHTIIWVFGLFISSVMTAIWLRHRNDVVH